MRPALFDLVEADRWAANRSGDPMSKGRLAGGDGTAYYNERRTDRHDDDSRGKLVGRWIRDGELKCDNSSATTATARQSDE